MGVPEQGSEQRENVNERDDEATQVGDNDDDNNDDDDDVDAHPTVSENIQLGAIIDNLDNIFGENQDQQTCPTLQSLSFDIDEFGNDYDELHQLLDAISFQEDDGVQVENVERLSEGDREKKWRG
ncbi:pheromone-processing carboxypeptidase KEX1-like [Cynara cardunculus var. scolymus]|uniref:pheromone-processing carboxypeptidase KEX1-like n=1 Tax=Cynara cardunculus var. scolymus TaxID=59895 RepID=UPI000D62502D|nr:pheromone-processing carboxypeptidase KEX1-like [Cynara cardunculus var. scolymus]